jgi:hypothetical protein
MLCAGEEGDLVIWDNRAVMHSTTPYEPYAEHRRLLWQIISKDTTATAAAMLAPEEEEKGGEQQPGAAAAKL